MDNRILNQMGIGKPNMAALEGDWGRQIMETIRSTPPPDWEKMHTESRNMMEEMKKEREKKKNVGK